MPTAARSRWRRRRAARPICGRCCCCRRARSRRPTAGPRPSRRCSRRWPSRPTSRCCSTSSAMPSSSGARTSTPAEAMIRKASELAPDDASITDSLGWAQFKRGKVADAIADAPARGRKRPRPGRDPGASRRCAVQVRPALRGALRVERGAGHGRGRHRGAGQGQARVRPDPGQRRALTARARSRRRSSTSRSTSAGKLPDGRHAIETIFAFCIDGDRLSAEAAPRDFARGHGPVRGRACGRATTISCSAPRERCARRPEVERRRGDHARQAAAGRFGDRRRIGRRGGDAAAADVIVADRSQRMRKRSRRASAATSRRACSACRREAKGRATG